MFRRVWKKRDRTFVRDKLEEIITKVWQNDEDVKSFIKKASDDDLKKFIRKYREGVHFANPVFDGANEQDIVDSLDLAGVDTDGQALGAR